MNRRDETAIVKAALKSAGLSVKSVSHGTGTACGWLKITLAEGTQDQHEQALAVAQAVTGRTGDYDGRINVGGWLMAE